MSITRKIRVSLSSFNKKVLKEASDKILSIISLTEELNNIKGPISLPTKKRIYCVLRSPHVDKDSREQFEIRRYKKIIDIYQKSIQTFETLIKLELPPGVAISIQESKIQ
jgi:small subunit ribosomal protein S10